MGGTTGGFGIAVARTTGTATGGMFGAAKPAGSIFGSSEFGQSSKPFGSTGFGTTTTTTTPSFSSGTNTTQPQTNAFGGTSTGSGTQTQAQTGTFGQPANNACGAFTSGFGSGTTSSSFGSTSNTTGGFGAPATTGTATGGVFGAPKPVGSIFGSTTTTTATTSRGTASPAYAATQERDSAVDGSSTTLHYKSITAMPAYRNFSFEELRGQDYAGGRKDSSSTGFGRTSASGATNTPTLTSGLFGQPRQDQSQQQTNIFGQPAQPATWSTGLFGQAAQTTGAFGQAVDNTSTSFFGQPAQSQQGVTTADGWTTTNTGNAKTQTGDSVQTSKTSPSFLSTRLGHAYTRNEWTGSAGCLLKISDCSCRFLKGSGGIHTQNSCTITPCSAKAFKALQTEQLAHARSIASLQSTVERLAVNPSSVAKPTQDSTACSSIQAGVRSMIDALRDSQAGQLDKPREFDS